MAQEDWILIESETLRQTIAFHKPTGWLKCKDGTVYNPSELRLIAGGERGAFHPPLQAHIIKKVFGGEIISIKERGGKAQNTPTQKQ